LFKYVLQLSSKVHLDLAIYLTRDKEFNRMSDGSDAVLIECDNFCLGISTGTFVQPIDEDGS